jgi:hypothetical protein
LLIFEDYKENYIQNCNDMLILFTKKAREVLFPRVRSYCIRSYFSAAFGEMVIEATNLNGINKKLMSRVKCSSTKIVFSTYDRKDPGFTLLCWKKPFCQIEET